MKQKIADYTVIISREKRLGTNKWCYGAVVPTLRIATEGDTLEDAQREVQALIQFHLDSLVQEGEEVPVESGHPFITRLAAVLPRNFRVAY